MIFCLFLLEEEKEEDDAACGGVVVMARGLVNSSLLYAVEKHLLFGK